MTEASGSSRASRGKPNGDVSPLLGLWTRLCNLFRAKNGDSSLRDSLEEIIEEIEEQEDESEAATPIGIHERVMLANILKFRHLTAYDVMVPRADIIAADVENEIEDILDLMNKAGHSRLPVYRETLDDVVGMVLIKDLLPYARGKRNTELANLARRLPIVAPSMPVLDLLLEMRRSRVHMALVVDEYGGIDGLVTIEDLVEEIVGEIEDEHDVSEGPKLVSTDDGSWIADARITIDEFEGQFGPILSDEERDEDIDTLGGLVFALADRVPVRGELIQHDASGLSFEILEADPRRIKRLRVIRLPTETAADGRDSPGGE